MQHWCSYLGEHSMLIRTKSCFSAGCFMRHSALVQLFGRGTAGGAGAGSTTCNCDLHHPLRAASCTPSARQPGIEMRHPQSEWGHCDSCSRRTSQRYVLSDRNAKRPGHASIAGKSSARQHTRNPSGSMRMSKLIPGTGASPGSCLQRQTGCQSITMEY